LSVNWQYNFVDKPSGSKEYNLSNKEDIVNAFLFSLLKWKKEHTADNYSTIKNESEHTIALNKFLDILHHDRFENKKAFTMSSLLDKCCSLLPKGLSTKYYTAKLQTRKEVSTFENLRSAFKSLAARIASATDIGLLKTIFD
jgi:hypothetical protein